MRFPNRGPLTTGGRSVPILAVPASSRRNCPQRNHRPASTSGNDVPPTVPGHPPSSRTALHIDGTAEGIAYGAGSGAVQLGASRRLVGKRRFGQGPVRQRSLGQDRVGQRRVGQCSIGRYLVGRCPVRRCPVDQRRFEFWVAASAAASSSRSRPAACARRRPAPAGSGNTARVGQRPDGSCDRAGARIRYEYGRRFDGVGCGRLHG